jgi:hypothetical protein
MCTRDHSRSRHVGTIARDNFSGETAPMTKPKAMTAEQTESNVTVWFATEKEAYAFGEGVTFACDERLTVAAIEPGQNKYSSAPGFVVRILDEDYDGEDPFVY